MQYAHRLGDQLLVCLDVCVDFHLRWERTVPQVRLDQLQRDHLCPVRQQDWRVFFFVRILWLHSVHQAALTPVMVDFLNVSSHVFEEIVAAVIFVNQELALCW